MSANADIADALMAHVTAFATAQSPPIDVAYVDDPYTPKDDEPYLELILMPNRTENLFLGNTAPSQHQGILQISVMWPGGKSGLIPATQLADQILAHFPKGARLASGSTRVQINRKGDVAAYLQEPDRLKIPVSIQYVAFA